MNFDIIKKKYPKAHNVFTKYYKRWLNIHYVYNERLLYDFFDKKGIVIEIGYTLCDGVGKHYWVIYHNGTFNHSHCLIKSRKVTEKAAFKKAFEILELKTLC
jgi:hypothetical protein